MSKHHDDDRTRLWRAFVIDEYHDTASWHDYLRATSRADDQTTPRGLQDQ